MNAIRCGRHESLASYTLLVLGVLLLVLSGCSKSNLRLQAEDDVEQCAVFR